MHGTWPCTIIKTRPRPRPHGMKLVSDAADPCQLLDDGRGGDRCLCCSYIEVTEQHSDVTDVCCCSGHWWAESQHIMFHCIHCVHAGGADPDCASFLQRAQCSHCKRCISYGNSVCRSVCLSVCLSVTRRYCVKMTARSTVQFSPLDSKMCLVLYKPKNIPQGRPLPLKFWLKVTYPLPKAASFDTFCLVAPQP